MIHFLVPCGCDFGTLGHHVGDPGVDRDSNGDILGCMVGFQLFCDRLLDPVGSVFYKLVCCFLCCCGYLLVPSLTCVFHLVWVRK